MKKINIIAAVDKNNLIGKKGALPWQLPADLKHFRKITTGHTVIMGSKTYESIGRPLPDRVNIVIYLDKNTKIDGCTVVGSPQEALETAPEGKDIFIIGGGQVFRQFLPLADVLYLTEIHHSFDGDIYFPEIKRSEWEEIEREDHSPDEKNPFSYSFLILKRKSGT